MSLLGCWLLWGCKDQEERKPPLSRRAVQTVLPLPLGLTRRQKSAGMAPALGMGGKDWKTPPRNEKPELWMSPSSECRERAVRKNYTRPGCFTSCPSASFRQPPAPRASRRPVDGYQQAINKTAGATGVNILALFGSSCLPLK